MHTSLMARSIVEQGVYWGVQAGPGDVFDTVAEDVYGREAGQGRPEQKEVNERVGYTEENQDDLSQMERSALQSEPHLT